MYSQDLTPYKYKVPFSLADVLNVGWLDSYHPFITGKQDTDVIFDLRAIMELAGPDIDVHVNVIRGIHPCNICGNDNILIRRNGRPFPLGMSEIWLPYQDKWLAAPSMILHYIEEHHYEPPSEFICAVRQFDLSQHYKGQDIYDRLVATMMSRH